MASFDMEVLSQIETIRKVANEIFLVVSHFKLILLSFLFGYWIHALIRWTIS
jgi:hypothetical protein